ncbi:PD-(D/E)XK nuclease-like domain-containing protein [Rhodococcus sp. IEGM 1379]|uniref:PD-(D/E)XK nuclease-like domain-containing protein n=1 Tax=Rhodococcus sp. IEGM 1379 TaxID=3047086 RepID=UPI0024B71328|nr:PD-(D/E)XK nuclease-like domain-containing protein [Rhodococcus sp. IEGM 1379]MDI9914393.1 PD-(D/E)XK nuclease-like domain-containing protein [Rhodococcus sp. IEGM 1379]
MTAPTEPGVYGGITDEVYHGDRISLSSSGARKLLAPSCPAKFRHEQDNPPAPKKVFDFGHAAHSLVLGYGSELREIPDKLLASNGAVSTAAAKEFVANARTEGAVALKPAEHQKVHEMADAIRSHETAAELLSNGKPEQSLYWRDQATGIMRRARPDWLPNVTGSRLVITDYKTAVSADENDFVRAAGDYGYHCQAPWYCDGIIELGIHPDPEFVFVVQEKEPPYLVNVVQLAPEAIELGRQLNRIAIETYVTCRQTGIWPGYGEDIKLVDLPPWIYNQHGDPEPEMVI